MPKEVSTFNISCSKYAANNMLNFQLKTIDLGSGLEIPLRRQNITCLKISPPVPGSRWKPAIASYVASQTSSSSTHLGLLCDTWIILKRNVALRNYPVLCTKLENWRVYFGGNGLV